jgi:hypothetical protein
MKSLYVLFSNLEDFFYVRFSNLESLSMFDFLTYLKHLRIIHKVKYLKEVPRKNLDSYYRKTEQPIRSNLL